MTHRPKVLDSYRKILLFCWAALPSSCSEVLGASYEEYDHSILDPHSVYGSPYGGFSRASRSRIGLLPLRLPDTSDEAPIEKPVYMQVRDADGQLYACRTYHEGELSPKNLIDSIFDPPQSNKSDSEYSLLPPSRLSVDNDMPKDATLESDRFHGDSLINDQREEQWALSDDKFLTDETLRRLRELTGVCGQIHQGWWSYEWCYEQSVTQFHVALNANTGELTVSDYATLGIFQQREVYVDFEDSSINDMAEDEPEFSRVTEVYRDGSKCPETGEARRTYVNLQCCSPRILERQQGLIHREQKPLESNIASVMNVEEDSISVCTYNLTICTPLLCGKKHDESDGTSKETMAGSYGNESIRGILDRTLGRRCLRTGNGGWWTYELCHNSRIRQYHEQLGYTTSKDSKPRVPKKIIDDEYNLGVYKDIEFPAEEEHTYVVNATKGAKGGGNGAYFKVEYSGGDMCDDDKDVKDAAIVAGTAGAIGVHRASSVRYYCGAEYFVSVNEDSTCHYLVEVHVPELCHHPLFKSPISKKQVVKCLSVEDVLLSKFQQ